MISQVPPEFMVDINDKKCVRCKRCTNECGFSALTYSKEFDCILADDSKCVACQRCTTFCPKHAIRIEDNPLVYKHNDNFTDYHRKNILKQAETGGILVTAMGCDKPYPVLWDHMLIDACQVTNPSIDPLREPMELRTYLGKKPDRLEFENDGNGIKLKTELAPNFRLDIPVIFGAMSFGAVSYNVHKALMLAAERERHAHEHRRRRPAQGLLQVQGSPDRTVRIGPVRRPAGIPELGRSRSRSRSARAPSRASADICPEKK